MASKKKKIRRYRLKTSFKRFLVFLFVFIAMGIYAFKEAIKIAHEFEYRETYEYKLMEIGYELDEARLLNSNLSNDILDEILLEEYNESYPAIVSQKYFLQKNFDTYVEYKKFHEKTSYEDVIALVNVHANKGWYNEIYEANENDGILVLVNKFYKLNDDYKRDDIENISLEYSYSNNKASSMVISAFEDMRDSINNELGVHLMINSSYRSYKDQEEVFDNYKSISLKYADSYAARPGHSEHQTALSIDITSLEHKRISEFTDSTEYQWLKDNCYKYGFILRYPENKEYITGYNNEPWHFRYVGIDVATAIYEENITFDEYYAYYIEK